MTDRTHVSEDFRVEQHVKVYLTWDDEAGAWYVDGPTFDGYPLDGLDDVSVDRSLSDLTAAELDIRERARHAPLPTGDELVVLLADYDKPKGPSWQITNMRGDVVETFHSEGAATDRLQAYDGTHSVEALPAEPKEP